jgi:glycosyltransferase involved in cell wall biosynthesis
VTELQRIRCVLDLQGAQGESAFRGIGRYSLNFARAMVRSAGEHEVWIALNGLFPETAASLRAEFSKWLPQDRIVVFQTPGPVSEMDPANTWRRKAAEAIRESFLASLKPDILHVSSMVEGYADNSVTSVKSHDPSYLTAATFYDAIPLLYPDRYLYSSEITNYYLRKLQWLKRADLLLAISESSSREAIQELNIPENRVCNISTGLEEGCGLIELSVAARASLFEKYGIKKNFLMYSGATDIRKNMEGLIAAFALLPARLRGEYQLLLAGKNDDVRRRQLQDTARRHGLREDRLLFTGFVDDADLLALYNTCSLFVLPSYHEGFGLPALEAMACGAPAIASNVASLPEVVGNPDALFDPDQPSDIARKIEHVLTDPDFRKSLSEGGLVQAKNFTWDRTARTAWSAFENLIFSKPVPSASWEIVENLVSKPKLAYFSPLPPEKSGISDYSAELLPELARFYEIETIVEQNTVSDKWVNANFPIRSVSYFERHASQYDRIVYQIGNSPFHVYMLDILRRYPGVIVLHDFFLTGMYRWMSQTGDTSIFSKVAFDSHGYLGVAQEKEFGRDWAVSNLPCNRPVIDAAAGFIVHSEFSRQLADKWYGPGTSANWELIPHLRTALAKNRVAARRRLGISNTDYLVCSFGLIDPTKLTDRVLSGWLGSQLARNKECRLVFVGDNHGGDFGAELLNRIACSEAADRIQITGYSPREVYRDYLSAADCTVQLRTNSRGETSGAVLDCLGSAQPTIVNAHAGFAELPDDIVVKLPDDFSDAELTGAFDRLYLDAEYRTQLAERAVDFVRSYLHPTRIAERYHEAIESFAGSHPMAAEQRLATHISSISTTVTPSHADMIAAARAISLNRVNHSHQLMLDVSATAKNDLKTGIERVARNLTRELIKNPGPWRVEPIRFIDGNRLYARKFGLDLVDVELRLEEPQIECRPGDIYLALDWNPETVVNDPQFFAQLRARNIPSYFTIYDLLPILQPDKFPDWAVAEFRRWLKSLCELADGVVCISQSVADELLAWLDAEPPNRLRPFKVGDFHLGADIQTGSVAAVEPDANAAYLEPFIAALKARPSLLMVGTLEPRKGHTQVLDAFELLWADGIEANLVIIGHEGWHVEDLVGRLTQHKASGKFLFWLPAADDQALSLAYQLASGLLAASEGEGFGLPLIEAARYGLPILARDLPVFREVAGDHAYYFQGKDAATLKNALLSWLDLYAKGKAPQSEGVKWLTWAESANYLRNAITTGTFYREWTPQRNQDHRQSAVPGSGRF